MNQNITDTNNNLSQNLQRLRLQHGFNKHVAAQRIGIAYSYYYNLESGKNKNPSYEILKKIATVYGVKVEQLYEEI